MPRSKATSAISRHLWNDHERTRSEGTQTERMLLHEEIHATAEPGTLNHSHGEDGSYVVVCPCGHEHTCTVLSDSGE
jgi:hypothetical protein